MLPWITVAQTRAPDGATLLLARRGSEWEVRAEGLILMSSRTHASEMAVASLALEKRARARDVLLGGLGLGFTLRTALDLLPVDGRVALAEWSPALVDWNRTHVADLAGRPLDDPRVQVEVCDVRTLIAGGAAAYDAILLDVDNGPMALVRDTNAWLYADAGVQACRNALRDGGVLTVWSAGPDEAYLRRLKRHGFASSAQPVRARRGAGKRHVVFVAVKAS